MALAVITLLLTVGHFVLGDGEWEGFRLFNLGAEGSFGTSFASILGLASGVLVLGAAAAARRDGHRHRALFILGIGLVLYAIDEVAMVHEGLGGIVAESSGREDDGMIGTALLGYLLLPVFLFTGWAVWRSTPRRPGLLITLGLAIFWLGGFGVEQLEHMNNSGQLWLTSGMTVEEGDFLLMGIQEAMEMAGVALVLVGALALMASRRTVLSLEAADSGGDTAPAGTTPESAGVGAESVEVTSADG